MGGTVLALCGAENEEGFLDYAAGRATEWHEKETAGRCARNDRSGLAPSPRTSARPSTARITTIEDFRNLVYADLAPMPLQQQVVSGGRPVGPQRDEAQGNPDAVSLKRPDHRAQTPLARVHRHPGRRPLPLLPGY